jgi:hypothetical protein
MGNIEVECLLLRLFQFEPYITPSRCFTITQQSTPSDKPTSPRTIHFCHILNISLSNRALRNTASFIKSSFLVYCIIARDPHLRLRVYGRSSPFSVMYSYFLRAGILIRPNQSARSSLCFLKMTNRWNQKMLWLMKNRSILQISVDT